MKAPVIEAYCSWCLEFTKHGLSYSQNNCYNCSHCNGLTTPCRSPFKCNAMAKKGRWLCCAHAGEIPGFRGLADPLSDLSDHGDLLAREVVNLKRFSVVAVAVVILALLLGIAGFRRRRIVGGAVARLLGRSRETKLTGKAAQNFGLAALGGGSLRAGGHGVKGGTFVVTSLGGVRGATLGKTIVDAYLSPVRGFKVRKLKGGSSTGVIVINGFLSEEGDLTSGWEEMLERHYSEHSWYVVEWESKNLAAIGRASLAATAEGAKSAFLSQAARHATNDPVGNILGGLPLAARFLKNPWHVAMTKAAQTGTLLATLIARTPDDQAFILIGHSLGARVIYNTLNVLAYHRRIKVVAAHLLGGAVGRSEGWGNAEKAVRIFIHNYFSFNDDILKILYKAGTVYSSEPIGLGPIEGCGARVNNHNVSAIVGGHTEYRHRSAQILAPERLVSAV